ncbi:hypothetical protein C8J57DRAFT_1255050 [Mycena rebaudengoi]|nr:hypothetical protein C8J57DRAFT_1255050 [Mycena rebaudengoi]
MCDGRASPPASPVSAKQGTLQRQAEQHTPDAAWENTVMALRLGDRKTRAPGYISCATQSSSADIAASLGDRSIDSDFKRNAASSYVPPHPCDPDRFGFGMWCAVQIVVAIARGVITVIVGDIADQRGVASHGNLKSRSLVSNLGSRSPGGGVPNLRQIK